MPRCRATTRSGAPCRNEALPGSDYCRFHQPKEGEMIVVKEPRLVRIRYLGASVYQVGSRVFSPREREQEVPERLAEFLLDTEPELFELAE